MSNEDWRETTFARDRTIKTLAEKIRALEAELAAAEKRMKDVRASNLIIIRDAEAANARAEKAEAELAQSRSTREGYLIARIAELEARLFPQTVWHHGLSCREATILLEAREKEDD